MNSNTSPVIVWFRQDLRLEDNPALLAACETKKPVLPLYILDDDSSEKWSMGGASRWWLHESLNTLNDALDHRLWVRAGQPLVVLKELIAIHNIKEVFWNRCYEPWRIRRDTEIKEVLKGQDIEVQSFNGSLLFEPHTVLKDDGTPYKVFTPFYKKGCLTNGRPPRAPEKKPSQISLFEPDNSTSIDDLGLLPKIKWYEQMAQTWQPGEDGAHKKLSHFLTCGMKGYKEGRNYPNQDNVSRLSPHLHFGEISPNIVWYAAKQKMLTDGLEKDGEHFLSEIGWREFSYYLLYHFPALPDVNLHAKFNAFPWQENETFLESWQQGQTGYPIIDAGMRELWQTGYMHNRVRMIVGSFLVKNLLLHWHHGEKWFWDTLVDADLANNSASWQWIAGCGADAAPYFRIFNPVTQGQKFDSDGAYVRLYVPEISGLPDKYIHCPWEAPHGVLAENNVILGQDYPKPIVELKPSRERALEAFASIKTSH